MCLNRVDFPLTVGILIVIHRRTGSHHSVEGTRTGDGDSM